MANSQSGVGPSPISGMTITYREVSPSDHANVKRLVIAVGWERRVADDARLARMIRGANRCIVACEENPIVVFGRALFDCFMKSRTWCSGTPRKHSSKSSEAAS